MKIIIVGNMGYIGPSVVKQFRSSFADAELIGFDIGYFAHGLSNAPCLPEVKLNRQVFGDVRTFPEELLEGVDAVVDLAAISNDPMGKEFEEVTLEVNYRSAVRLAEMCKRKGVKNFVFASSCSVYGAGGDAPKKEDDELNPLTAYARSKIAAELELEALADDSFTVTCHRFATACGFTDRIRLDLVLNDFVAGAIVNKNIEILSDGTPWRPMINTKDMARAFEWSITRHQQQGGAFLAVNTGSNEWNYQIKPLAEAVADQIPGVAVSVNADAPPDKRSYCVNFDLFKELAPDHQPIWDLESTIRDLKENLGEMGFSDPEFRESQFIRLKTLARLRATGKLDDNLEWVVG
ncbi:NAD-dependent epimerase/dehydratase family protein [Pontiella sulfatireligans]|uniref:UDP-glucose 4-epimerase n=1 Tax=Pontiella sulfatireligans TaxID=2750658 RepID=A0A6C2UN09_9BACT|nr:NAD-dependent epimerase/dehydratase [Pontiella sulfatireligans]VGO21660.1 UDP-glucose 4-epimerase [Pontiella sulfatireligans]